MVRGACRMASYGARCGAGRMPPHRYRAAGILLTANDTATPGDVLTYGMGYGQQRYSPLDQINSSNANALAPVWAYSLNDGRGQ